MNVVVLESIDPNSYKKILALLADRVYTVTPEGSSIILSFQDGKPVPEELKKISERKGYHFEKKKEYSIPIGRIRFTKQDFLVIAGPCSCEDREVMDLIAKSLSDLGVAAIRAGAYKPRTSPYSFQGRGKEGLIELKMIADRYGLAIVSEIMQIEDLPLFEEYVDLIQVGTRNMYNYPLLKALGKSSKPILLKRGLSATLEEWLFAAEYILSYGNDDVILCERGIRTFEKALRNTLDLGGVAYLKQKTDLPIIVDPSHGSGIASLVTPLSLAAAAVGADGLLIEAHTNPTLAFSDTEQTISIQQLEDLLLRTGDIISLFNKRMIPSPEHAI